VKPSPVRHAVTDRVLGRAKPATKKAPKGMVVKILALAGPGKPKVLTEENARAVRYQVVKR
jgi:hypothetical protein